MKKKLSILAFLVISISYLHSQTIVGKWEVTSKNEVKKSIVVTEEVVLVKA